MTAAARTPWRLAWLAGLVLLLAACDRKGESPSAPAASTPASGASAPSSTASQPASSAQAPPLVPEQVAAASSADPQLVATGQQLASQGSGAATACVGCHGAGGEGNAQSGFPRLAGQGKLYLVHQLESYANGSRRNAVMQPIAAALNDAQRQAVAAFYATQGSAGATPGPDAGGGREPPLAAVGDNVRQLQACANCHGPQGIGDAAANPYLAGQHASYLTAALGAWKSGDRNNDPSGQMPRIARTLGDADVQALVAYYAGLPPPAPRNAQAAAPPLGGSRATVQSGPATAAGGGGAAPVQGSGTEQGALTGGAQSQAAGGVATNQQQVPGNTATGAQAPASGPR